MQVVLQTPTELVVHDGRWTTVLMGAIFSAMGGGVMYNYSYDGMQYQASSVTPISMSAGEPYAADIRGLPRRNRLILQLDRSRAAPPDGAGAEAPGAGGEQRMSPLSEVT